jgi:hypothetical protein
MNLGIGCGSRIRTSDLKVMSLTIGEMASSRNFTGELASERAIILLRMDWHFFANRALL